MIREIETKFYTFSQNNSGGYFVQDDKNGVTEYIVIEAQNKDEAWRKLEDIGDKVSNMFNYCSCCGERWSNYLDDSDGKSEPMIYDTPIAQCDREMFRTRAFVHYYDGSIKEFVFPERVGV